MFYIFIAPYDKLFRNVLIVDYHTRLQDECFTEMSVLFIFDIVPFQNHMTIYWTQRDRESKTVRRKELSHKSHVFFIHLEKYGFLSLQEFSFLPQE